MGLPSHNGLQNTGAAKMGNGIVGNRLGVTEMPAAGNIAIDSLARTTKWDLGSDRAITFSFAHPNAIIPSTYPTTLSQRSVLTGLIEPSAEFQTNVIAAMATWEAVANIKYTQIADTETSAGDVRVFLSATAPAASAAFGYRPFTAVTQASPGDVVFYNQLARTSTPGTYNFSTLIHELGHALGLKHPGNYDSITGSGTPPFLPPDLDNYAYSVMSYNTNPMLASRPIGPSIYDILAVQHLYGANLSYAPGDQSYALSTSSFRTIWDPNGENTLSGQSLSVNQTINAKELAFSSAGGAYTAAVAKGTRIANLEGGRGDDTLIGNALDNRFTGGRGNDTITSGGGTDTAVYSGVKSRYVVTQTGTKVTVADSLGGSGDGVDTLKGVKWLSFADGLQDISIKLDPIGVAISDQLSVVYLGRGVGSDWRDSTATVVANGASSEILKAYFAAAVSDRAFAASDNLETIADKTFLNIFGLHASAFEQAAWADTVAKGYVTREALPWAMFNSYLAATNVPPSYQIPAQSRIIAAHSFTQAINDDLDGALGGAGVAAAEAARAWLLPIRSQSDAAGKVKAAAGDVASLATGGTIQKGVVGDQGVIDTNAMLLVGVHEEAHSFGP